MRRLGYVTIFCWAMVIIISICFMFGNFRLGSWSTGFGSFNWTFDFDGDYEGFVPISEDIVLNDKISDIEIEWVSGDINVVPHDDDFYKIVTTVTDSMKDHQKAQYRFKDGNLDIIFCKPKANINVDKLKKELTLYVPKDSVFNCVNIVAVSSRMNISGFQTTEFEVRGVSGNVIIANVTADSFEADNVSGSYTITNSSFTDATIQSVSGDVDFDGSLEKLDIDTVSGDYKIRTAIAMESLDVDGVSANVNLHMPDNSGFTVDSSLKKRVRSSDFSFSHNDDDRVVYGDGSRHYDFDTVSGDLHIHKITP